MKYDDILAEIGEFGPYQKRAYFILCTPAIMKAAIVMSAVFVLSLPDHRCAIPGLPNDTFQTQGKYHSALINQSIPEAPPDQENGDRYDHCHIYTKRSSSGRWNQTNEHRNTTSCHSWVYDKDEVHSSVMTEFDFVCDKKVMRSHTNMGFFCGSLVGSFVFGAIADIIGRKKGLLLCIALQIVCGTSLFFVPSMVWVVVVRSVQGMAGEMFAISASTGMELVAPPKRTFTGMAIEFFWCGGQFLVLLVAYLSKDWRITELVFGVAAVPLFILICFSPESPRWLLDKERYDEAEKILEKIAESNKTQIPVNVWTHSINDNTVPKSRVWMLFSNRKLFVRSVIMFYNWFAVNFLYYGLSLNLDNLSGSLYINFLISLAVETAAFGLCFGLLERTGRRSLHTSSMFTGSIACLMVIFPVVFGAGEHQWMTTTLAMVGKMAASACYAILYIMTVEMFPTIIRNSALGVCSVFENVAGMVSPYVADMGIMVGGSMSGALPTTVFGGVALLAALLSLTLPETRHKPMPETIEDAIELDVSKKYRSKSHSIQTEVSELSM